jgi:suppressor of ftsI
MRIGDVVMQPYLPGGDVTRRRFLGLGAGAVVAAGILPVRGAHSAGHAHPPGRPAGPHVGEPQVLTSRHGRLQVTLVAEERWLEVAGRLRKAIVYNGSFPAPTLVVSPGDRLEIHLVNRLQEVTNLHTHGFHVSPEGRADNVLLHIEPGESFHYRFDIPRDHPPGLNWYHPHPHGHGVYQLFGGMAGAILVRARSEGSHGVRAMRERVMMLQSPQWDDSGELVPLTANVLFTQLRLVNGELNPTYDVPLGTTERWRIVNASPNSVFDLVLDDHDLVQIGADSHFFRRPDRRGNVLLAPGQRADLLVTPRRRGEFALRARPFDEGLGFVTPDTVLATVSSRGRQQHQRIAVVPLLRPFRDLRGLPVDRARTVTFSMKGGFTIDGKKFDPSRTDHVVELGAHEEWTVVNDSPLMHPFHIHVNPFQLTHVNGEPVEVQSYQDTQPIEPGGSITFRSRFLDFTGRSVLHCHIVTHSDLGMMATFEIVPPGGAIGGGQGGQGGHGEH